jgi:hypothetical protein
MPHNEERVVLTGIWRIFEPDHKLMLHFLSKFSSAPSVHMYVQSSNPMQ